MALELGMQGGRSLWGLALFAQLACGGGSPREFGRGAAGAGGAVVGAAAGSGGKSAGGSGESSGRDNAGAGGAARLGMCASAADCAALPHVREGAQAECNAGKCSVPASSCEKGYGHCTSSDLEFCETSLDTATDCGACGKKCEADTPFCEGGVCVSSCTPAAEDCFNGKDDDCDDKIDCADLDCYGRSQCVPGPTTAWAYGASVGAQATCPSGFLGGSSPVHGVLNTGNGCSGCACETTITDCAPYTVTLSMSPDSCNTVGPILATIPIPNYSGLCDSAGINEAWNDITWSSTPTPHCANTGKPTLPPATWTDEAKFCAANVAGGGCGVGEICAPIPPGPITGACLLTSGRANCPTDFPSPRGIYAGFVDGRTCNCSCQARGGSCDPVRVNLSTNKDCSNSTPVQLNAGGVCGTQGTTFKDFSYKIVGTPTPPSSCDSSSTVTGTVTPSGEQTLCCQR